MIGFIDVGRISLLIRACGETPTEGRLGEIAQAARENGGKVSYEDLVNIVSELRQGQERRPEANEVEAAFRVFDTTNSGLLHKDKLKRVLTTFGDKLSEKEADDLVAAAPVDDQGRIDYVQFAKILIA